MAKSAGSDLPDPETLASWESAFAAYPISAVRRLDQTLHGDLDANRDRLRTLVGASYRDLLSTAARIVEMDKDMRNVEAQLVDVGRRCNVRSIEMGADGFKAWTRWKDKDNDAKLRVAAQLSLLDACCSVSSQLIRSPTKLTVAVKVLIIARLIAVGMSSSVTESLYISSLSAHDSWLNYLKRRAAVLRTRIIHRIDRIFASLPWLESPNDGNERSQDTLADALCAYALATSTSAGDVLREFHRVRLKAMHNIVSQLEESVNPSARPHGSLLVRLLKIFSLTARDTQALFPARMVDALSRIREGPLLGDKAILSLSGLQLDVRAPWVGSDLKSFTPWTRWDDLDRKSVERGLKEWVQMGNQVVLRGLQVCVNAQSQGLRDLVTQRKDVINEFLSGRRDITRFETSAETARHLDGIRSIFNKGLKEIVESQVRSLSIFSDEISSVIIEYDASNFENQNDQSSLWSLDMTSLDPGRVSAKSFKRVVLTRVHGETEPVRRVLATLEKWQSIVREASDAVTTMQNTKWHEYDDDDDDNSDDEDEDIDGEEVDHEDVKEDNSGGRGTEVAQKTKRQSRGTLLSRVDPSLLGTALDSSLRKAYADLDAALLQPRMITELGGLRDQTLRRSDASTALATQKTIFLFRTLRSLGARHKGAGTSDARTSKTDNLSQRRQVSAPEISFPSPETKSRAAAIGQTLIKNTLLPRLAQAVTSPPLDNYISSPIFSTINAAAQREDGQQQKVVQRRRAKIINASHALWESLANTHKQPEQQQQQQHIKQEQRALPTLPSRPTFTFLLDLVRSMARLGEDLWGSGAEGRAAVEAVHSTTRESLIRILKQTMATKQSVGQGKQVPKSDSTDGKAGVAIKRESQNSVLTNETSHVESSENNEADLQREEHEKWQIQLRFDATLLARVFSFDFKDVQPQSGDDGRQNAAQNEHLTQFERERIDRAVAEYWKRTRLLFGLLA